MKTSDFSYHLPKDLIAQHPASPRDSSRLMVYDRSRGRLEHRVFNELVDFLEPEDLLVINQTKVIRARLFGKKVPSGGKVELLLLRETRTGYWEALVGGKGIRPGTKIQIDEGPQALVEEDLGRSLRLLSFQDSIDKLIDKVGNVPLPPYIHEPLEEPERYQTIYARESGSAAAPTAGLHFTSDLMARIRQQGVGIEEVTLHIGLDTFAPVHETDPRKHHIHTEWCRLSQQTAGAINSTKANGGRVIAVGTTTVRTLETAARASGSGSQLKPFEGQTDLFILPGFDFQVVDCLLTNFHLPESTLLMLVSAFAGREKVLSLYEIAKQKHYRFYSFGDAMLIL